jgi:hypothetical protein
MFALIKQYLKSKTVMLVGLPLALLSAANVYFEHNLSADEYSMVGGLFTALIVWARAKTDKALADK